MPKMLDDVVAALPKNRQQKVGARVRERIKLKGLQHTQEEQRDSLTREALADVNAGQVVDQ